VKIVRKEGEKEEIRSGEEKGVRLSPHFHVGVAAEKHGGFLYQNIIIPLIILGERLFCHFYTSCFSVKTKKQHKCSTNFQISML